MKDFFIRNKRTAAVLLAVIIAVSIVGGTVRSVSTQRAKLDKVYTQNDKFGMSAGSTLETLAYHANSFQSSYISALGSDENSEKLSLAVEIIEKTAPESSAGIYSEYNELCRTAIDMYSRLVSEDKFTGNVRNAYNALDNDISILKNYSDYNNAAEKYNSIVSSFPAAVLGFEKAAVFR